MSLNYADAVRGKISLKPSLVECQLRETEGNEDSIQVFADETCKLINANGSDTHIDEPSEQSLEPSLEEEVSFLPQSPIPNEEEHGLSERANDDIVDVAKTRELPTTPLASQDISVQVSLIFSIPKNVGKVNLAGNSDGKKREAQNEEKDNDKPLNDTEIQEECSNTITVEDLLKNMSQLWKLATHLRGRQQSEPSDLEYMVEFLAEEKGGENKTQKRRVTLSRACDLLTNLSGFISGREKPIVQKNNEEDLEEYYANDQVRLCLSQECQEEVTWANFSDLVLNMYLQLRLFQRATRYLERFCNFPVMSRALVNEKLNQQRKRKFSVDKVDKCLDHLTDSMLSNDNFPEIQARWKKLCKDLAQQDEQVKMENADMRRILMSLIPSKEDIIDEWNSISSIVEADRRGTSPATATKYNDNRRSPKSEIENENDRVNNHHINTNSSAPHHVKSSHSQQQPSANPVEKRHQHPEHSFKNQAKEPNNLADNESNKKHHYNSINDAINRDSINYNSKKPFKHNPYSPFGHEDLNSVSYSNSLPSPDQHNQPSYSSKKLFKTEPPATKKKRKSPILEQQLLFPTFRPMPPLQKLILTLALISILVFFFFLLFSTYSS
ncbi:uncharacterized protein LOC126326509 [Schistocerca gregaria]|uniref:uncharacterized protein LOC126326509 n=1 Tax=Schistocerca gregaria TaxID=7010 RepID=UPI00211E6F83|nr:uncharacterized protein LOC126326509 [Schistocerca gregaria]